MTVTAPVRYSEYGAAALHAASSLRAGKYKLYGHAWREAVEFFFPLGPLRGDGSGQRWGVAARDKSCPRSTFIELCERGWLIGVDGKASWKVRGSNRGYAAEASRLLATMSEDDIASLTPIDLWRRLKGNLKPHSEKRKVPNSQMDVVLALWSADIDRQRVAADSRPCYPPLTWDKTR